jgi:hypothetical protein
MIMRRVLFAILLIALPTFGPVSFTAQTGPQTAQDIKLPMKDGSVKFAVLGDTGTGSREQVALGKVMATYRAKFPFEFAVLLGDNLYGGESPRDYEKKFAIPYKPLLDAGVKFYASLGNHDDPNQRMYKLFNMNGERYYSFRPSLTGGVRFFALDSNYMDPQQVQWLEKELAASGSDWKIAFFHHPMYASGMHGSDEILKKQLEPIFMKHGVNLVLTGHEHFYERIKPQKGIQHFVVGATAKLRKGDLNPRTGLTAFGYDTGYSFMLMEVAGDEAHFQVVNERGQIIDSGVVRKGVDNRVTGTAGRGTAAAPAAPAPARGGTPAPAPAPSNGRGR